MAEEKKDSKSKIIIILLIIVIVLLIGGGVTAFVLLNGQNNDNIISDSGVSEPSAMEDNSNKLKLDYDSGAVALDADSLQRAYDEMVEKTKDGYISIDFYNEAISTDGENFQCRFGNSELNKRDMFVSVYLNGQLDDEFYLSGLLRPGQMITNFKSSKKLDDGTYDAVLVFSQVEDDHETLSYQTSVVLTLKVGPDVVFVGQ